MTTLKRPFNAHRMQQLVFEIVHGQVRSIDVKLVDGAIIYVKFLVMFAISIIYGKGRCSHIFLCCLSGKHNELMHV